VAPTNEVNVLWIFLILDKEEDITTDGKKGIEGREQCLLVGEDQRTVGRLPQLPGKVISLFASNLSMRADRSILTVELKGKR
jgi:hypothetical protein